MKPEQENNPRPKEVRTVDPSPDADDLQQLLESGNDSTIRSFLRTLHPADLAMLFDKVDDDLWPKIAKNLSTEDLSDLMEELDDHLRDDLAELMHRDQLVDALEAMDSDDAADVIADLPKEVAKEVLKDLPTEDRQEVERLLEYPEDTAGGIMQVELVSVHEDATIEEVIEAIRANADEVRAVHYVYMVDENSRLTGILPLERLLLAQPNTHAAEVAKREFYTVLPETDQEQVARMFKRYDLVSMAVVNEQGVLLGRITHDDVIDVLEEEIEEDILRMEGLEEGDLVYTNRIFKIASIRLPWLLANVLGGLVAGHLLWSIDESFPAILALVSFAPVIAAMGGNIGSQSNTIVVRGLATGKIDFTNWERFLFREMAIGTLLGIACGSLLGVVAGLLKSNVTVGLTVGTAMAVGIMVSAIMGVMVPMVFRFFRIDPAIASGPLVTSTNDIISLSVYYAVAFLFLS